MLKTITLNLTFCFFCITVNAQNSEEIKPFKNKALTISWGWNWSSYSDSDIRFKGKGHDFTLKDVMATHRPTEFDFNAYFVHFTTPQYNFKISYFFNEHWNVSFGVDHMKYVMIQNQDVYINGLINEGTPYDDVYTNEAIQLSQDFLTFEHTDGLNYLYFGLNRFDQLFNFKKINGPNIGVNVTEGFSAGIHLPKTNSKLLGKERNDTFHLSGYGLDVNVGLNLLFFDYVFIQGDLKLGFVHMPDIRSTTNKNDKAEQHFFYNQQAIQIGGRFPI
ncbi:hypothetical protein KMW28_25835 [Flammeovirga yaeyamensis]|uniref:Outermembrane protein n=1 Tax=Flammeovirga yaeyamensis TaxID=367791 RepID=A0AAX1N9S1_9BACT|nr:hypothetical protein [Flammeovirga yaeyamensis]MBB3699279.1 hypothetical protein [Flammeovirga yaeyamensis]NMF35458.1 hypothetical protein [Flammeovirga yaeyamensis]QWG04318.1 hypothetical protein KMW28_25835 [Flammeovirga yaeyamensis]